MDMFVMAIFTMFHETCGCAGYEVDVPGFGLFRVYEATCEGEYSGATKENPILVLVRDEAPLDLGGSHGKTKSGHEGPFLN